MRIVKPSFHIEEVDGMELLKKIEKAGRTCYKSEDRITDDSALTFVKTICKSGRQLPHPTIVL